MPPRPTMQVDPEQLLADLEAAVRAASGPAPTDAQHKQLSTTLTMLDAIVRSDAHGVSRVSNALGAPPIAHILALDYEVPLHLGRAAVALWGCANRFTQHAMLVTTILAESLARVAADDASEEPPSRQQRQQAADAATRVAAMALRVAVAKQLTQSGLIQLLPQMLQQLAGELDALAPQPSTTAQQQHTSTGRAGSSGSSSRSRGSSSSGERSLSAPELAFMAATYLLFCCGELVRVWPGIWASAAASAALVPLPRLVVATLRAASAHLARTVAADRAAAQRANTAFAAAAAQAMTMWRVVFHSASDESETGPHLLPSLQQLWAAPDSLTAAVLVMAVACHAEAAEQQQAQRQRQRQQQQQAESLLSPCVRELLQPALGITAEAVKVLSDAVSALELSQPGWPFSRFDGYADAAQAVYSSGLAAPNNPAAQQQPQQQLALTARQHLLMAALQLQCARQRSHRLHPLLSDASGAAQALGASFCNNSVGACVLVLSAYSTADALRALADHQQQQQQQQPLVLQMAQVDLLNSGTLVCAPSGMPPALLGVLLSVALQLLQDVLRQLRLTTTATCGSSSTGGEHHQTSLYSRARLAQSVVSLLQVAAYLTSTAAPAAGAEPGPSPAGALWQRHAAALMGQLQELLRLVEQLPANGVHGIGTALHDSVQQLWCLAFKARIVSSPADVLKPERAQKQGLRWEPGPLIAAALAAASADGGADQQQAAKQLQQLLCGLMCRALKVHRLCAVFEDYPQARRVSIWLTGALFMLQQADVIAGPVLAAAPGGAGAAAASTSPLLPWLVLAGRCCLLLADRLQALLLPGGAGQQQQQPQAAVEAAARSAVRAVVADCELMAYAAGNLMDCFGMATAEAAAAAADTSAEDTAAAAAAQQLVLQAAAAGLCVSKAEVQALQHQLADACAAAKSLSDSAREVCQPQLPVLSVPALLQQLGVTHEPMVAAVAAAEQAALASGGGRTLSTAEAVHTALVHSPQLAALLDALQVLGSSLCSLPIPHACNNPRCTSLARDSEQALVGGRGSRCSGCRTARYCGRACQTAHWRDHRRVCRAMGEQQQAVGAAGASGGGA